MANSKCIYKATTLNAAEMALDELKAKWGRQISCGHQVLAQQVGAVIDLF